MTLHCLCLVAGAAFAATPGEDPVGRTEHVVGEAFVQPVFQAFAGVDIVLRCARKNNGKRDGCKAEAGERHAGEYPIEHAQRNYGEHEGDPRDDEREHAPEIEVLDMPDVFGDRAENLSRAFALLHPAVFQRFEQAHPQAAGHAEHPVVRPQALEVPQHRFRQAK